VSQLKYTTNRPPWQSKLSLFLLALYDDAKRDKNQIKTNKTGAIPILFYMVPVSSVSRFVESVLGEEEVVLVVFRLIVRPVVAHDAAVHIGKRPRAVRIPQLDGALLGVVDGQYRVAARQNARIAEGSA